MHLQHYVIIVICQIEHEITNVKELSSIKIEFCDNEKRECLELLLLQVSIIMEFKYVFCHSLLYCLWGYGFLSIYDTISSVLDFSILCASIVL